MSTNTTTEHYITDLPSDGRWGRTEYQARCTCGWSVCTLAKNGFTTSKRAHMRQARQEARAQAAAQALQCDMLMDCQSPVAMIDAKGYVYCASHGVQRRQAMPCRKLRQAELVKLGAGEQIAKY